MVMKWYKQIKAVLNEEPELWLSYIHGQQLDNITHLKNVEPRYRGLPIQLAKFSYLMLRTWHPAANSQLSKQADYFFFAGTSNQMDSLESTIEALQKKGASVIAVAPRHLINRPSRRQHYTPYTLSTTDMMKATLLLTCRGARLYKDLNALHPKAVDWWYSNFCTIYTNLPYFQRAFRSVQPKVVITANDHNAANRCMLAIAHQNDIKTAYLQHASVSRFFPALKVNYAFLDGQHAADIYRECENNQPKTARKVPEPQLFLSGQKKSLRKLKEKSSESRYIGLALNSLDDIEQATYLLEELSKRGHNIIVRWHPGQPKKDIEQIRHLCDANEQLSYSDAKQESVGSFLFRIHWLIAGNSSIHLEAALADVNTIYYEIVPAEHTDYYGYVKHGIARHAKSVAEISEIINSHEDIDVTDAVRHYSATYKTEWEGREGELVAEVLSSAVKNKKIPISLLH